MNKILPALACAALLFSCNENTNDPTTPTSNLTMNFTNLSDLGANSQYEGWLIVGNEAKSIGTFTVNGSGVMSKTSFNVNATQLASASAFVLTVEPRNDTDPNPSNIKILAGSFSGDSAVASVADSRALGVSFVGSSGAYILATPTDGNMTANENSGVWFIDRVNNTTMNPGFKDLPALPANWVYEGWAVINGTPVTTGKFRVANAKDSSAPYSGTAAMGPNFPGEDFLMNAPAGLSFPTDLRGAQIVLTVEPSPDNDPMPFPIKPLVHTVPASAVAGMTQVMFNQTVTSAGAFPRGVVRKK